MVFLPAPAGREPIWNSDTDEIVVVTEGAGSGGASGTILGTVTVPAQCTYMIFTLNDIESGGAEVYISPDSTDQNSGYALENGAGGQRNFGTPVEPGTLIYLHSDATGTEAEINVLRFYTKK